MKCRISALLLGLFCFITFFESSGHAACADVKGTWKYTGTLVYYDAGSDIYGYTKFTMTIHVTNQSGCLFYGYKDKNVDGDKFSGAVNGTSVTITAPHAQLTGELRNFDPTTGKYKSISMTGSLWPDAGGSMWPSNDRVGNFTGTMTRR